jgi:hypothetical protein
MRYAAPCRVFFSQPPSNVFPSELIELERNREAGQ